MVTDAMIAAARDEFLKFEREDDIPHDEVIRRALEAAEKAAWRPISEHKRDEDSGDYLFTGGTLLCASVEKGYFSKCNWEWMTRDFMICDDDEIRRPAYFRPLPTPPRVEA